jgi:hypothetical protein
VTGAVIENWAPNASLGTLLDRLTHHAHVATPYCPGLDMNLFSRLTVGQAQHEDIRDCVEPQTWSPLPVTDPDQQAALRECRRSQHRTGRCCHPHPARLQHHDSAGRARSVCPDKQRFRVPGRSKVVMVEPTGVKPVKLTGWTAILALRAVSKGPMPNGAVPLWTLPGNG